ncbi:MAG: hypothetical protein ACREQL_07715, partial [Candidatus Binatia bacterium]
MLGSAPVAHATHFRYGNLSWQLSGGRTILFQLSDAFRRTADSSSSNVLPCVSPSNINTTIACTGPGAGHGVGNLIREDVGTSKLEFGDGNCEPATCSAGASLVYVVTSIDTVNNWSFAQAVDTTQLPTVVTTITHTYGGSATTFTARLNDCCRISNPATPNGHINNPDNQYTLSTNVIFTGDNHSPISTQIPIVNCCYPALCTFFVPASDPDVGDTLSWRLATGTEASASGTAFAQPGEDPPANPDATINSATGEYSWNTAGTTIWRTDNTQGTTGTLGGQNTTLYSTQIIIEDGKSKTPVDFLIKLNNCAATKPTCSAASPQNVLAGSLLSFPVSGSDPDPGDKLTLNAAGLPAGSTMTPPLPIINANSPVSSNFSWTPTLLQVGQYIVQYSVTDLSGQQALCPVTINVTCSQAQCNDNNPCTTDTCTPNGCLFTNNTAPCTDNNACTQNDTCSGGSCQPGAGVVCQASDQCHIPGMCNPATGLCSNPNANNGTGCTDGNACTQADACQGGVCTGSNPVVCTALDQCHIAGTCDPASGMCSNPNANNGTGCTDGNACTQTDTCQGGSCVGMNPVVCTASDRCHDPGVCNPANGLCTDPATMNGTACNNPNNLCNQTNTCQGGICTGSNPVVCAPLDQCHLQGTCNQATGTCSNPEAPDNTSCNDGNACTQTDTCQGGSCTGANPVICTASDQCHNPGVCDTATGQCSDPAKDDGSTCNDGDACTLTDTCVAGGCTGANPVICTPLDQCHVAGTCDPATGDCSNPNANSGTLCDDSNGCTEGDMCTNGQCTPGGPKDCGDPNPCTDDSCEYPTGNCIHTPNTNPCDDGDACTVRDTCSGGDCAGAVRDCGDGNLCTDDGCDPLTGCTNANNTDPCDDQNLCTTNDKCKDGFCQGGPAPICDDNNPCTTDGCSTTSGCTTTDNDNPCDDQNPCTSGDACSGGQCAGPSPTLCNDNNGCTTDTCDPAVSGGCVYSNNTAPCSDQTVCTDGDTCGGGTCNPGPPLNCNDNNACTVDSCHPVNGCERILTPNCEPCQTPADCDNHSACDGVEKCVTGMCASGTPPICVDNNVCTTDGCNPASGCTFPPNTNPCSDNNPCTTIDACSGGTCVGTGQLDCNDHDVCTDDACSQSKGCTHTDNSAPCNDNNPCTTVDACHNAQCIGTIPPSCDDQNVCTTDACNPSVPGGCTHAFNTEPCTDGNDCTVNDTCSNGACTTQPRNCSDNNPCTLDSCDDTQDFLCVHDPCYGGPQSNQCRPDAPQCVPDQCG